MHQVEEPRLAELLRYWLAKRGDRPAPSRADIDPMDIPNLLPIVTLLDVLHDPLRFRFRLVGTAIVEGLGRDATGRFVDEGLYGSDAQAVFATCKRLTEEIRPFRRGSRLVWKDREWQMLEAIELPLLDGNGQVEMILGGHCFTRTSTVDGPARTYEPLEIGACPGIG